MTKLWLITATAKGHDVYDSAVVASNTERQAKEIHPSGTQSHWNTAFSAWVKSPDLVTATYVGTTRVYKPGTVVLASFNAG